ncbi:MAG: NADH-quinone oxidoreductase subunit N [Desulfomonile tiedjei]|uniref:NADH-quinone oxidoreductase subunit N n=1 Tax=Desulfomonile tiedjei TaxID=2358 RepID=A0A9D6V591_9BACT|nr:NADH-quinone oxidoreductase subunit N [Desulfomonile tiedjei]
MIPIPEVNLGGILPALVLCLAGLVVMMLGLFIRRGAVATAAVVSIAGVLIAAAANTPLRMMDKQAFAGLINLDAYTWFFNLLILISAGLTVLTSVRYLTDDGLDMYEYFVLLLFASAGMMFMVSANHLLIVFVGLETLSIAIYVLVGILPSSKKSKEAALKYLLLGAFSSAVFLYGAALLYGSAGSLGFPELAKYFKAGQISRMAYVGMGMVLVGFAFKVAAVPFHMWTPDVYEGAPAPLTGFMSVGVKAAAFAAFVRVFFQSMLPAQMNWIEIIWLLAALTMVLGNLAAIVQDNIKRMLAYSSIAHAGYLLIGMVAGKEAGPAGMLYYLLAYTFTNLGAFGVVALVGRKGEANVMIDDYRGLAKTNPFLALAMSIFLFSLAGIPPTAGFVGKFTIFSAAINAGYIWLVVIGVLTSAASVFYYFRVVMKMYMEVPETQPAELQFSPAMLLALGIALVGVLYIGVFPTNYLNLAALSVKPLF